MNYLEFQFFFDNRNPIVDVFKQELADIGFEAFQEDLTYFKGYIPKDSFNKKDFDLIYLNYNFLFNSFKFSKKPYQNWNKKWESEFEIIEINEHCSVRASFHEPTQKNTTLL